MMKKLSLVMAFIGVCVFGNVSAQKTEKETTSTEKYADIAPGFKSKKLRKKIAEKMDELMKQVVIETDCSQSDLTYTVVATFDESLERKKRLPKTVIIKACDDQKLTYVLVGSGSNTYSTGSYYGWRLGTWVLNSTSKPK